jgi:hypothetical protein
LTDNGAEHRLQALISQVFGEVHGRGTVSGIHAGLRSWKATFRTENGQITAFLVKNGVAIATALLVVPLIAGSIASFGALPIAAAIAAVAGLLTKKLVGMALHARDVNAILALVRKGEDEQEITGLKWDEVAPKLGPGASDPAEIAEMAERIFSKLVSDFTKLDGEIEEAREFGRKHLDATDMVAFLLKAEVHILEKGHPVATLPGFKYGDHQSPFSGIKIGHLSAKSSEFGPPSRALHRLRRIRFYLRWMTEYMRLHENSAIETINDAIKAEQTIVQACLSQVMITGNHENCGSVCFAPKDGDLQLTNPPAPTVSAQYGHVRASALDTRQHAVATPQGMGEKLLNDAWKYNKKEEVKATLQSTAATKAVESLVDEHTKAMMTDAVAGVVGSTMAQWTGGFVGDSISAAMGEAVQRYRVNRPLQNRVRLVRQAMQENEVNGLDEEITKLAGENDVKAVLQAFLLAHSHYPKRILERTQKLQKALTDLQNNGHAKGQSPFASCTEAATTMRYLVKVFHQAEKQAIHILFVKFALEAMDRKIFREGYKRMMRPVLKDIVTFDRAKLVHVDQTRELDPLAVERAVGKALLAQRLAKEAHDRQTQEAAALAKAQHDRQSAIAALKGSMTTAFAQAVQLAGATFINAAPFAHGAFKGETQAPQLAVKALTMDEWRAASNVFLRPRSQLTLNLDVALQAYLRALEGSVTGQPAAPANVAQKASLEKVLKALQTRANMLRAGVHAQLSKWLNDKASNVNSARRPAVQQLAVMVETELHELESTARACKALMDSGERLAMFG